MTAPLTPYRTSHPLEIVACDLIDVGLSTSGNRYILSIIDLFTKFGTAVPIPDKKGETVLKAFIDHWAIGEGRVPEKILTDQGKEFLNENFRTFTEMMGIEHIKTKGYNSRSNGAVERFNQTLMHIIKKKNTVSYEWDQQIAYAVFAYNAVAHKTTGETPFFLMNGRDPRTGLKTDGDDAVGIEYTDLDEYRNVLVSELNKAHAFVRHKAGEEQDAFKHLFDTKHKTDMKEYPQAGSRVLVEIPSEKLGARCPKLINKWRGPYRVISCSENSAKVTPVDGNGKEILQIPFDNLRMVPSQMDDTPIITQKKRRNMHESQTKNDNACNVIEINSNEIFFSEIYQCRCCVPCLFKFRTLTTRSPTRLNRMVQVKSLNPHISDNELQVLALPMTPGVEFSPADDALMILSACDTISLWAADLNWSRSLELFRAERIEKFFGKNAIKNSRKSTVFLLPDVREADVPLHGQKFVSLSEGNEVEQVQTSLERRRGTQDAIFLLPFTLDDDVATTWQQLIHCVPSHTDVLVVPAFSQIPDFLYTEAYALLIRRLDRPEGKFEKIVPDDMIKKQQNRTLISFNGGTNPKVYWEAMEDLIVERELCWPRFEISEKRCAELVAEKKDKLSTPTKGTQPPRQPQNRQVMDSGPIRRVAHDGKAHGSGAAHHHPPPYLRHGPKHFTRSPFKKF